MSSDEYIECKVKQIVEELINGEKDDEIVTLIFMSKYDAVLFSQVSLALGKGKYFASSKKTLGVLNTLQERGLVRKISLTYRSKRITAYILTECGLRVAKELARMFGV
ncbi:hypothetical protein [Thermofilum sp.]|jgi:hypothetical protein|uniref:hypothetical protein n=1 Tax=Thermofilum sp. TaxID=1961369 RepID=UPI0025854D2A|nr:hypothetical protein [Thermofilum sp.]